MTWKLCLHGVRVAHPETFTEDVAKLLKLTVKQGKLREKEYGENCSARYRRHKLTGGPLFPFKVRTLEGILLAEARLSDLRDVEFTYSSGQENLVKSAVHKLLSGGDGFVLAEPDLKLRLDALSGKAYPHLSGDRGWLKVMRQELYWQALVISWFWHLLYNDPENKLLVRQLRVKIRRLRSCLVFFKEGLPEETVLRWQTLFREDAEALSNMRELDVAALACQRGRNTAGDGPGSSSPLQDVILQLRQKEQDKFFTDSCLNLHTEILAEFMLWLNGLPALSLPGLPRESGNRYVARRLGEWSDKLISLNRKYPDFSNMEDLHRIRIKVKRFRYVTQTIELARLPLDLLRQLKQLQDVLGLLHDDYVNAVWAKGIALQHPGEEALQQDIQAFLNWQSARSESALALVPEMWESFVQALKENLNKN